MKTARQYAIEICLPHSPDLLERATVTIEEAMTDSRNESNRLVKWLVDFFEELQKATPAEIKDWLEKARDFVPPPKAPIYTTPGYDPSIKTGEMPLTRETAWQSARIHIERLGFDPDDVIAKAAEISPNPVECPHHGKIRLSECKSCHIAELTQQLAAARHDAKTR